MIYLNLLLKIRNILIPKNRLFITEGVRDSNHKIIPGTKSIPDALLITLDQDNLKATN